MNRKSFGVSLVALSLGLLLCGARFAKADTIAVQDLTGPTGTGPFDWAYTTSLSGSGEIQEGDYVEVDSIPGFLSTSADDTTANGADGTVWNISYNFTEAEVEAIYTGNVGTVKGAISDLVNLAFLDSSGVDGGTADWSSDDHAAIGSDAGDLEAPLTGQIVDAPMPSAATTTTSVPEIGARGALSAFILLAGALALLDARKSRSVLQPI